MCLRRRIVAILLLGRVVQLHGAELHGDFHGDFPKMILRSNNDCCARRLTTVQLRGDLTVSVSRLLSSFLSH